MGCGRRIDLPWDLSIASVWKRTIDLRRILDRHILDRQFGPHNADLFGRADPQPDPIATDLQYLNDDLFIDPNRFILTARQNQHACVPFEHPLRENNGCVFARGTGQNHRRGGLSSHCSRPVLTTFFQIGPDSLANRLVTASDITSGAVFIGSAPDRFAWPRWPYDSNAAPCSTHSGSGVRTILITLRTRVPKIRHGDRMATNQLARTNRQPRFLNADQEVGRTRRESASRSNAAHGHAIR